MLQLLLLLHYQSPPVTSALRRKKHPNYIFFPACFSFRDLIESILFSLTLSFVLCIQSISSSDVIFLSFISSSSSRIGREKRWIAFDRVPLSHWLRRHTITHIVHTCIIFSALGADDKYSALWISHPSCFPAAKRQFLLLLQTRSLKCRPNKAGGVDSWLTPLDVSTVSSGWCCAGQLQKSTSVACCLPVIHPLLRYPDSLARSPTHFPSYSFACWFPNSLFCVMFEKKMYILQPSNSLSVTTVMSYSPLCSSEFLTPGEMFSLSCSMCLLLLSKVTDGSH